MYHVRNSGTYYDAGFMFGSRLKKFGIHLLDVVPFAIDEERITFALSCEPYYKTHYPTILQEIKGLADGQDAAYEKLCAVLLSMYCIMPEQKCTNVCFTCEEGYFLGRDSDFLTAIEKYYMNCIYRLKGAYAFQANTTAFLEMEDGMNEHGLAVGFTSIYPTVMKPGINAGFLVRYLLEKCKTTQEAITCLRQLPIASSQTLAIMDAHGDYAIVECNCEDMEVIYPSEEHPYVLSTNAFHSDKMSVYKTKEKMDDWRQEERYQETRKALEDYKKGYHLEFMKNLLSGKYGFICQYDRSLGADTVWSTIYDTKHKKIYRVEGNPKRKRFKEDTRFSCN